jgi:glycerol-3-phosphate dehydrogenase
MVGPDAENINDKENTETTDERLAYIKETARKTSNKIPFDKVITSFAGLRASSSTHDFVIGESKEAKGFINVAGIESPGIASAPAIAKDVTTTMILPALANRR